MPDATRAAGADAARRCDRPWNILVTGIGGTGIVTIGALLGIAAHCEGKRVTVLDQMGMAQKGGACDEPYPPRRPMPGRRCTGCRSGGATAESLLGCDLVVSAGARDDRGAAAAA